MRLLVFATCLTLVALAVHVGDLWLALALSGVKATLVGLELMEVRHAAWLHVVAFVGFVAVLTGALTLAA
ncbi:MAG: hypothetical protein H6720_19145 [Sandaracinus sp.]|nr:hypothetical protein [Sandaracinus sp.]